MCNNSKRNAFPMQSLLMTVSVHTNLTIVSNGKFDAMLGKNMTVNFFQIFILKKVHFIEQNIKATEKLNYRKILAYLLYTT